MSVEKNEYKLPKGYYIVAIGFILITLIELLGTSGEGEILINLGFYEIYVSFIGVTLCKVYIYNWSIYGLLKNKLWGMVSTTSIALYGFCINIRHLNVQSFIFLLVFVYLMSVIIKNVKNCLEI